MGAPTRIRDEFDEDHQKLWDALPEELQTQFAELYERVEFDLLSDVLGQIHWHQCQRCGAAVASGKKRHRQWHAHMSMRLFVTGAMARTGIENTVTLSTTMTSIGEIVDSILADLGEEA